MKRPCTLAPSEQSDRDDMTTRIGIDIGGTFTDLVFMDPRRPGAARQGAVHARRLQPGHCAGARRSDGARRAAHRRHRPDHAWDDGRHQRAARRQGRARRADHDRGLSRRARNSPAAHARALRYPLAQAGATGAAPDALRGRGARSTITVASIAPWTKPRRDPGHRATCSATEVDAIAVCLINAYANGAHEARIRDLIRAAQREHPRVDFERAAARNPRIRAHQHDGRQLLRAAAGEALSRQPRRQAARAQDRQAADDHAVERRRDERAPPRPSGRFTSSNRVRRPVWSARPKSPAVSAT